MTVLALVVGFIPVGAGMVGSTWSLPNTVLGLVIGSPICWGWIHRFTLLELWACATPRARTRAVRRGATSDSLRAAVLTQADAELEAWLAGLVSPAHVSLEPPRAAHEGSGIGAYLLALAPCPPLRGHLRSPRQAMLRYLVTAWAASPADAHGLLERVLLAALERTDLEVDLQALDGATWLALGASPQASFVLAVPVRHPLPQEVDKPVRQPVIIEPRPIGSLRGVLLGPGEVPLAGAEVVLASLPRRSLTDAGGRFELVGVPLDERPHQLEVHARGRTYAATTSDGDPSGSSVIRIDLWED